MVGFGWDEMKKRDTGAKPFARLYFTGCSPLEIGPRHLWAVIFNRQVMLFLMALGAALAALPASSLVSRGSLFALAIVLIFLVMPLLVAVTSTCLCRLQYEIAWACRAKALGYDGARVHIVWFMYLLASIFAHHSWILLLLEAYSGKSLPLFYFLTGPIVWAAASEVFSAAVAVYVLPQTGFAHTVRSPAIAPGGAAPEDGASCAESLAHSARSASSNARRFIRLGGKTVDPSEALVLKAEGNYIDVIDQSGGSLVRGTLSSVLEQLDPNAGVQVHRSCWVSFAAVETLERDGAHLFLKSTLGPRHKIARPREKAVVEVLTARDLL